jgi:hypothetical protein
MSRGWTYQEAIFPRRRLYFTEDCVYFQCCNSLEGEGLPSKFRESGRPFCEEYSIMPFSTEGQMTRPSTAIEQYTRRKLTFEMDTLRGLQGVLSAYNNIDIPRLWGVPEIDLMFDTFTHTRNAVCKEYRFLDRLCWSIGSKHGRQHIAERRLGFPSWSWAGWKGAISYDHFVLRRGHGYILDDLAFDAKVWVERGDGLLHRWEQIVKINRQKCTCLRHRASFISKPNVLT